MIFFVFVIILVVLFPFYISYSSSKWANGKIPFGFLGTSSHFAEMLTVLGLNFVRLEKADQRQKMKLIYKYIHHNFHRLDIHYKDIMSEARIHKLSTEEVGRWFALKVKSEAQRSNILYFVTGICTIDGQFNSRELTELRKLSRVLNLPEHYLDKFIAIHYAKQEKDRKSHSKAQKERRDSVRISKKENSLKILGLSPGASADEIKKAYRSLAKIHHPDMQRGKSKIQHEIARQKFMAIQEAYEYLAN